MPVIGAFKSRAKKSTGGEGSSALTLALKTLNIQEDVFAAQNDGATINNPSQLRALIDSAKDLYGLAENEKDKLTIAGKVATWEARMAGLERTKTKESISFGLENIIKDSRYNAINQYANSPIDFLKAIAGGYYALADLGYAEIDNLESTNRLQEANVLRTKIKDAQKEVAFFEDVWSAKENEDYEKLQNYAVVYRTDSFGNVVDMGFRRTAGLSIDTAGNVDDIGNNVVPLVDKYGQDILAQGVKVFVNKQNEGGLNVVKIGGQVAKVGQRQAGYDIEGSPTGKMNFGFQQSSSEIARLNVTQDEFYDNTDIISATPASTKREGTYAVTSGNRIFRFNKDFQWDEIAPSVLKQFSDYSEKDAMKVPDVIAEQLRLNSGKLITEKDLAPMSMLSEPVFKPEPEPLSRETPTGLDVTPRFTGGQSLASGGEAGGQSIPSGGRRFGPVRTNRPSGVMPYSGRELFGKNTEQLIGGNPQP